MLHLLISFDDPMERLLYGEPDPVLVLMTPRHYADGRGHTHHGGSLDEIIAGSEGYGGGGNSTGDAWSYSEPYNPDGYGGGGDDVIESGPGGGGDSSDAFGQANADGYEGPSTSFTTDEPDRPQTPAERDFDAFLVRQTRTEEGLEAGPDTLLRSPDGEAEDRDETEALIVSRGKALGLTDQQIAQVLTRYRTARATSAARPNPATAGLGAATDPATALLGAGVGPPEVPESNQPKAQHFAKHSIEGSVEYQDPTAFSQSEYDAAETAVGALQSDVDRAVAERVPLAEELERFRAGLPKKERRWSRRHWEELHKRHRAVARVDGEARRAAELLRVAEVALAEQTARQAANERGESAHVGDLEGRLAREQLEYANYVKITRWIDDGDDSYEPRDYYQNNILKERSRVEVGSLEAQLEDARRGDGLATAVEAYKTKVAKERARKARADRKSDRADRKAASGGGSAREYTVAEDGTVSFVEDGKTYQVSDDDLAQDVREAAASGDASGLTGTQEQVTVSTGDDGPVAAVNYNVGGDASEGNYGSLRASQEAWFREQLANLPDDPAQAAALLAELSARADELNAEWQGRDATFVGPDGQPITGAEYFAQVSASLSAGANENAVIADRNAALPDAVAPVTTTSQPNAGLGDRFNADKAAIDERAEALAALASDIRDLQEQWTGADTQGWTLGVDHDNDPDTPRLPTTAPEWWGDYAAGIETAADANRGAAERTAASGAAVADFNAASSGGPLSPADYARLAEEWRNRPDNELVQIQIDDPALAEGGGVVHQTPSAYFARLSGDPNIIAAEEERERERRILPGETGGIGAQAAIDPVTGAPQVSQGVAPLLQARQDEREQQERFLPGETGGIGAQAAIDPVTGAPQVSQGVAPLLQARQDERAQQELFLPGETGGIGAQAGIDPVTGAPQVSQGVAPLLQARQDERAQQELFLPGETGGIGTQAGIDPVTGAPQVSQGVAPRHCRGASGGGRTATGRRPGSHWGQLGPASGPRYPRTAERQDSRARHGVRGRRIRFRPAQSGSSGDPSQSRRRWGNLYH